MLRRRFFFSLLPLLLLLLSVGWFTLAMLSQLRYVMGGENELQPDQVFALEYLNNAMAAASSVAHTATAGRVLDADQQSLLTNARAGAEQALHAYIDGPCPEAKRLLNQRVEEAHQVWDATLAPLLANAPSELSIAAFDAANVNLERAVAAGVAASHRRLATGLSQAQALGTRSLFLLLPVMVCSVGLWIYLSYRLSSMLTRPIEKLSGSIRAVAEGNYDQQLTVDSRDELGRLTQAFNLMAARLRSYQQASSAQVLRAQSMVQAVVDSFPDPILVLADDDKIEIANPVAHTFLRQASDGVLLPGPLMEIVRKVRGSGTHHLPATFEGTLPFQLDGETRYFLPRAVLVRDDAAGISSVAMVLQDFTRFRLLDEVKSHLVSTVSHELKTPMTSLRMAIYLLVEQSLGPLNPKQAELAEYARLDVDRLLSTLDDLLDLARLEQSIDPRKFGPVPVEGLIVRARQELREPIREKEMRINLDIAPDLPPIRGDAEQMATVVRNFLGNAVKYSPPGSEITFIANQTLETNVYLAVKDQGPGIAEEKRKKIFDRFYRVPGQRAEGTGLGLAISRQIVLAHGGLIGCKTKLSEGAEFFMILPSFEAETHAASVAEVGALPSTAGRADSAKTDAS